MWKVSSQGWSRVGARTGTLKNPTKCLWRWEPDRRSYFFFSPPAHLCAVTYMTEISLIVTLNKQFNSTQLRNTHVQYESPITCGKKVMAKVIVFIRPSSDGSYYGMLMSVRVSVRPTLRPSDSPSVCPGLRPPAFRTFLLHALTYWAEILHMKLFWCTTDQVWVLSLCANFWRSYASLWTQNIGNVQFSAFFSYMLLHIKLKFCIWLCFNVLQIKFECRHFASIFEGVMPLCELRI